MVAQMSYVFADALSGEVIQEIPLTSVSFKYDLDGGEFRSTFHLDLTGKDNDTLIAATTPGRTTCTVEREGIVIGDFIIWSRTYQSQAKVAQLYGIPIKDYTECRIIRDSYAATNTEQRNIILDLYELMQTDENSISVDLPEPFPLVVPKSLTVAADEYKTYRQVINSIADTIDGFDWLIRTERVGSRYRRWLDIGYPQIGAPDDGIGIPVFEYIDTENGQGGNIINYWCNDSMGSAATNFFGIGSGEGTSMVTAEFIHTNLLASRFPRYDATVDKKDISSATILAGITSQHAQLYKAPMSTITVEVKADVDPVFGSVGLGDAVMLQIQDPRFAEGFTKRTRLLGWEYYPPEDSNVEYARLNFEGDEI